MSFSDLAPQQPAPQPAWDPSQTPPAPSSVPAGTMQSFTIDMAPVWADCCLQEKQRRMRSCILNPVPPGRQLDLSRWPPAAKFAVNKYDANTLAKEHLKHAMICWMGVLCNIIRRHVALAKPNAMRFAHARPPDGVRGNTSCSGQLS